MSPELATVGALLALILGVNLWMIVDHWRRRG